MAGAKKHMERSHRSHRTSAVNFIAFNREAYSRAFFKQERKSIGQRLAEAFAPLRKAAEQARPRVEA